jgi:TolB-like protein
MAEEILDALSGIQGLRVSSRTASFHFRTPDADTREIGRRLRVGTLLEGSVRKSGDQLRIVVQLIDAESGFQLWSGRYSRQMSDIFAVQQEIAENVVRALEATLSSAGGVAPDAGLAAGGVSGLEDTGGKTAGATLC